MLPTQAAELFCRHCAVDHRADALYLLEWSAGDWAALLARSKSITLARNDVLIKRGQVEQSLFLVASGALEVNAGGGGTAMGGLFREGPGAVIGEQNPARGFELLFALGRVLAFRVRRSEHRTRADAF